MDRLLATITMGLTAASLLATPASATELQSAAHARGFVIHDAQETLERFCRAEDGRLWFELSTGVRWELITSTSDPAITNPGDGRFHAYDAAEVARALSEVKFPLDGVAAEIFILPFPRRAGLESAAGPGLILLSPGVRELPRTHQHSEFTHELGHVVQYARMPDSDAQRWGRYAAMRGLSLQPEQGITAHADKPHEIFAEDFRALFGGALANESGTIENAGLTYPTAIAGLEAFFLSLALDAGDAAANLSAPSVARGAVLYSRSGSQASPLDVYDVTGRRLATLAPSAQIGSISWTWDGRDARGREVHGVTFARARDGIGGAARVTRL